MAGFSASDYKMVEMSTEAEGERLISKYIRPGEKHPLSEATIGRSGPFVWRVIRFFQASGDPDQVIEYFGFSEPTPILEAALAYYDRFKPFIDAKILLEADIPEGRPSVNIPGHITGLTR